MKQLRKRCLELLLLATAGAVAASCGGGSGGSGGSSQTARDGSLVVEGTLRSESAGARVLGPGEGGLPGVQVSALGDAALTDENGNFTLVIDGTLFAGGPVEFTFAGNGIAEAVVLEGVLGGPGVTAYTNFILKDSGRITGESTDAAGAVLGTTPGGDLGCDVIQSFIDGGLGALWKPVSESHGTPVILMPPEYRNASVEIFNNQGDVVDGPLRRNCCSHNGGREHVYLTRTAGALAATGVPLTVRFRFPDGFTDCRTVPDPHQRYD